MMKIKGMLKKRLIISLTLIVAVSVISIALYSENSYVERLLENSPTNAALKYYQETYGKDTDMDGVRASLIRLGCHQEIRIYKDDKLLMKAIYESGRIYELGM